MGRSKITGFGIYQIRHIESNRIYIGSTTRAFAERWAEHRKALRGNRHYCKYLQNAWNKYGENAFSFEVIEIVMFTEWVLEREQYWLDWLFKKHKQYERFNSSRIAGKVGDWSDQEYRIRRTRQIQEISKTEDFKISCSNGCKRRWQEPGQREKHSEIALRRYPTYEGFIDPNGIEYKQIKNLKQFARERNLDLSAMLKVHKGKLKSYKGWRAINGGVA